MNKFCKNCLTQFLPPVSAPHKEFCCATCRIEWWKNWNLRARRALAEAEKKEKAEGQ